MYSEDKTKKNFDIETKIRLLVTLINDEGKDKLANNIDKLTTRLVENKDKHFEIIKNTFINTISQVPLKSTIYAFCLSKILKFTSDSNFIIKIISGLIKVLYGQIFADDYVPIRIIRFFVECYRYKLINKEIIDHITENIFNFSNYENEGFALNKIIFIFAINFPYFYTTLDNQTDKDSYLNKLETARKILKKKYSNNNYLKYTTNIAEFDYLQNLIESFINAAKENKIKSDFLLDLDYIDKLEEEPLEYNENILEELHLSTLEQFKVKSGEKLILENLKFSNINNSYFDFAIELEKGNPSIMNENIFLSDVDKIFLREIVEDAFLALDKNLSILFINYLSKISYFFGVKKNLDFTIIIHLINMIIRTDVENIRVLEISNILNRFSLVSSNFSNNKFNSSIIKEVCFILINKTINEGNLKNVSIENFCVFLSFYISNQEFNFPYEKLNLTDSHHSAKSEIFKKMLIDKLCFLGTHQKISGYLTDNLKNYFPKENKPYWKFSPNEPFYYDTDVINDNIQYKKEFSSWSEKFESTGSDYIYILLSCLFYSKSKTLSHLRESIIFYKDAINHFVINSDTQIILLSALFDVWGHSHTYLKFLIEFLLNQNIIDHIIIIKFICEKLKDMIKNGPQSFENPAVINDKFILIKNYFLFTLIDFVIIHCEKSMSRLKSELIKEQEILAVSDETLQTGIIKSIEFLEENIEKIKDANNTIHEETLFYYLDLYSTLINNENSNDNETKSYENEFLVEKLIFFFLKHKYKLKAKINQLFNKFDTSIYRIKEIIDSLNDISQIY